MWKLFPFLFSVFFVFTVFAETTHDHKQSCDEPCPAVCLGCGGGMYCDNSDSKCSLSPVEPGMPATFCFETVFVSRLSEDEIFHPPAV
jgi:hypothetical protein